jgi:hypothetical protein
VFAQGKKLTPRHFNLVGFHNYYLAKPELAQGERLLRNGRVLILGRPAAGKTRMAYELAKMFPSYWVLRVEPDFKAWEKIQIPHSLLAGVLGFAVGLDHCTEVFASGRQQAEIPGSAGVARLTRAVCASL